MKKTFSLSAAQAALLIVLINNEYSFGTSIDTQILSFGPIPQPSEKKYPLEVDKEEIQNILSVLGIANDDDELSEKHDDINELSLFFVNSEFQDAKEELTEVAETEQIRPIVFDTIVNTEIRDILSTHAWRALNKAQNE